jgi:hypothetical protein
MSFEAIHPEGCWADENGLSQPAIRFWNDTHHLVSANEEECSPAREQETIAINEVTR